jgi:hypothetical protein
VTTILDVKNFLDRTRKITLEDLVVNRHTSAIFRNTMEELGEVCNAVTIELGEKTKPLDESSKSESVDLLICVLSLYFVADGDPDELRLFRTNLSVPLEKMLASIGLNVCKYELTDMQSERRDYMLEASILAAHVCYERGLLINDIIDIGNLKLSKWELGLRGKTA